MSADLRHLGHGVIEEGRYVLRPGLGAGGGAGGFERGVEPGVEDFDGGLRGSGHAGDREDVGVVDGAGVEGLRGGEAGGGKDAGELVGHHGDADAGAAGDKASGLHGGGGGGFGRGGDAAADLGGDGVVGGGAEVLDLDVEAFEVGDKGVLEVAAEGVGAGYDLQGTSGGGIGHRRRRRSAGLEDSEVGD